MASPDQLVCYLHLNDFERGKVIGERCFACYKVGSNNWFIFSEFYFLFCMRSEQFGVAKVLFKSVVRHIKFDNLAASRREKWRIYHAYLQFLEVCGLVDGSSPKLRTKRFKVEKFLNEVPIFSKDKRGYNIAILIIHILFLLKRERFGEIIDRMGGLRQYRKRYLKQPEDIRSSLFIKMLMVMERQSFDYLETKIKTHGYFEELKGVRFRYEGMPIDPEVVGYEVLWGVVLGVLRG